MRRTVSKKRMSSILLRAILSVYFIVVCLVTIIQLIIEYRQTKNDVLRELQEVESIFSESLITALWTASNAQVDALVNGIIRLHIVTGIEIVNRKSGIEVRKFLTRESDLLYKFDLFYMFEENKLYLATITVYSDHPVVFDRVKVGFLLLLFSAFVRSFILTALFIWAVNKYLNQPLTRLVNLVENVDVEKIGKTHFDYNAEKSIELHQLCNVFQKMNYEIAEYVEDITKAREMYQNIFDHVQAGIFRIDDDGNLLTANRAMANIAGYAHEEELMRSVSNLKTIVKKPSYASLMGKIKTDGQINLETVIESRKGGAVICELSAYKLAVAEDQIYLIEGMFQDLSEKKAKETALREKQVAEAANQAKSEFLANMSHELRSPLNAILGFAQVMERCRAFPAEHQEHLGIIRRSGEHLLVLINQVLDLSKIEAGRTTRHDKNFDLHRLLHDMEDMFALKAEDKNLQLIFERDESVPRYIRADEVKLRQVLINLLSNAVKFTKEGGVTVGVSSIPDCRLGFEIEDTGPGIAPEETDAIFEAFSQSETGKQSQEGIGLGLPISRKFVQLMGGDIQVNSRLGQGTMFSFDLQTQEVKASDIDAPIPVRRVTALEPGQPRYRILIADDLRTSRQLIVRLLSPFGFELREAANGQKAVEIWETWHPHLIWMDMHMPVMNGYEATKKIKSQTTNNKQQIQTVIIALTASSFEEERAAVLQTGCDDYLRKPFREAELFDLMSRHIGVKFVYEKRAKANEESLNDEYEVAPKALSALPAEWLLRLRQGAEETDVEMLLEVTEQIREQDVLLANALMRLAEDFEYNKILACIQDANSI